MILRKLKIQGFRSFYLETVIEFDEEVTILTGPNDVGKSNVLRLIRMFCEPVPPNNQDANIDKFIDSPSLWNQDKDIYCIATFALTEHFIKYLPYSLFNIGDEVDILFYPLMDNTQKSVIAARRNGQPLSVNASLLGVKLTPTLLYLAPENTIQSVFRPDTNVPTEQTLLELAFGPNPIQKFISADSATRSRHLREANKLLNKRLKRFLPHSLGLELMLGYDNGEPSQFTIGYRDRIGSDTPVNQRGDGIRKLTSLMLALATLDDLEDHVYILCDEPENSLHADSQHLLRNVLENLASQPNIQVIYVTHSPAMINNFKTSGLRLLERVTIDGKATTRVVHNPENQNFYPVRIGLGLTPSDSLLYAPVTIILEGLTELHALPYLLLRLKAEAHPDFSNIERLIGLVHFIEGSGESLTYWCDMAESQGSCPILFVDGDKIRRVKQASFQNKRPDVPVVHLNQNEEFENIVLPERYIEALSQLSSQDLQYLAYQEWEKSQLQASQTFDKLLFSKRIERWLQETVADFYYDKPKVMKEALRLSSLDQINLTSIKQLYDTILQEVAKLQA